MLAEAAYYAAAWLRGQRDPHGHLAEQVALWARHRRRRAAWSPHLERCRALAMRAALARPKDFRRTALVLGPGLLLEVPLPELASAYGRVVLADMCFLPAVRALARGLGNVELRETDLTGLLGRPAEALAGPLPEPLAELARSLPELDFAYSANLLSQLPLFFLNALGPGADDGLKRTLGARLVRQHLDGLLALPCPAALVTDVAETGRRGDRREYQADLLFGVDPGLYGERWTWNIAPDGEAQPGMDVERLVLGVTDVRSARRSSQCP